MEYDCLIAAASEARKTAYVPYSRFPVGAAVMASSGHVYTGCNIENASYGLTLCAERTAIFKAITAGERRIVSVAVIADTPQPTAPCGACRQVMAEFGVETVIMASICGKNHTMRLSALLPNAFKQDDLGVESREE